MTHRPDWTDYEQSEADWLLECDREPASRPFSWRLIISLFALQLAGIGAFLWWAL